MAEVNKSEHMDQLIYDVFNTEKGKELLSLLVDEQLFNTAYSPDEKLTYVNLGKQAFVLALREKAKMSPSEIRQKIDMFNNKEV